MMSKWIKGLRLMSSGWKRLILPTLLMLSLTSCAHTPTPKIDPVKRPTLTKEYQGLIMQCPTAAQKAVLSHEWEWHGYADKMEKRLP